MLCETTIYIETISYFFVSFFLAVTDTHIRIHKNTDVALLLTSYDGKGI